MVSFFSQLSERACCLFALGFFHELGNQKGWKTLLLKRIGGGFSKLQRNLFAWIWKRAVPTTSVTIET